MSHLTILVRNYFIFFDVVEGGIYDGGKSKCFFLLFCIWLLTFDCPVTDDDLATKTCSTINVIVKSQGFHIFSIFFTNVQNVGWRRNNLK